MKEIKQTKETLEMTPADRTDIIEECNRRLTVLEAYAPKMMGEDEIRAIIEGVLSSELRSRTQPEKTKEISQTSDAKR